MNRKLVFFGAGFAVMLCALQLFDAIPYIQIIALGAVTLTGICFLVRKHWKPCVLLISGAAVAIGWLACYPMLRPVPEMPEKAVPFTAQITDYSFDNNQKSGIACRAKITSLQGQKIEKPFTARIYIQNRNISLKPGDELIGSATFEIPENDKDFRAFTYYKTRGVDAIAFCKDIPEVMSTPGSDAALRFLPQRIAQITKERISELLPQRAAGFIRALILGDKSEFTQEDQENFSVNGLAHVVAVSGMHVAFLASFIILIVGRRRAIYFAVPLLLLFTLIVGAPPSVVRAFIMQLLVLLAPRIRREPDGITSLMTALLIILFLNPYSVLDIGLQLSFLATLGLILYSGRLNNFFQRFIRIKRKRPRAIVSFFTSTLAASLTAILFTSPIIAWEFRTISLIAPICNLLLIGIITVIFLLAILGVAVSFLFMPLGRIILFPAGILADFVLNATDVLAKIPHAEVYVDNSYYFAFIAYFYVMLILMLKGRKKSYAIPISCMILALGVTICFANIPLHKEPYSGIRFTVLDVGQGASMIAEYQGTRVMVDCGGSRSINAGNIARDTMRKSGYDTLDALILTHMHADHINGAKTLLERSEVRELYVSADTREEQACKNLVEIANRRGTAVHYVSQNTDISKNGLRFMIYPTSWLSEDNEKGLVVLFKKDDFELIVTGDLEHRSEKLLCQYNTLPDVEAYVVGHHGSDTSSSLPFINTILPEFAVISVGTDNPYGHPNEAILSLFHQMGIETHRTDEEGTIVFYSDEIMKGAA